MQKNYSAFVSLSELYSYIDCAASIAGSVVAFCSQIVPAPGIPSGIDGARIW